MNFIRDWLINILVCIFTAIALVYARNIIAIIAGASNADGIVITSVIVAGCVAIFQAASKQ